MKKNFRLLGISLLVVFLTACIAVTSLTPAPPTAPALLPTSTAFSPGLTAVLPTNIVVPTAIVPANTATLPVETLAPGPAVAIDQIHMLDQTNGWGWNSQSSHSRLLRTQDGGATWMDVSPQGQSLEGNKSFFLDAQTAWIAQFYAADSSSSSPFDTLLRTIDGGKTWVSLLQKEFMYASYEFTNSNDGIATIADRGTNLYLKLYKTHDGGATWSPILINPPKPEQNLKPWTVHLCNMCGDSLYYDPARLVITYGDLAYYGSSYSKGGGAVRLSVSTDLGQHWKDLNLPLPDPRYADSLVVPKSPVFFGDDGLLPVILCKYDVTNIFLVLYITHDGGQSWSQAPAVLENHIGFFDTIQVLSTQDVFVRCGKNLCATHDGAQTWLTLPASLDFDPDSDGSYVPQFEFIDPKTGWAVVSNGSNYELWKSTDGGATWMKLAPTLVQ